MPALRKAAAGDRAPAYITSAADEESGLDVRWAVLSLLKAGQHGDAIQGEVVIEGKDGIEISPRLHNVQRKGVDVGEILVGEPAQSSPYS